MYFVISQGSRLEYLPSINASWVFVGNLRLGLIGFESSGALLQEVFPRD